MAIPDHRRERTGLISKRGGHGLSPLSVANAISIPLNRLAGETFWRDQTVHGGRRSPLPRPHGPVAYPAAPEHADLLPRGAGRGRRAADSASRKACCANNIRLQSAPHCAGALVNDRHCRADFAARFWGLSVIITPLGMDFLHQRADWHRRRLMTLHTRCADVKTRAERRRIDAVGLALLLIGIGRVCSIAVKAGLVLLLAGNYHLTVVAVIAIEVS